MSDDRQHRIRQRAHAIWESHGRPHGRDREHWDQATREVDAVARFDPAMIALIGLFDHLKIFLEFFFRRKQVP